MMIGSLWRKLFGKKAPPVRITVTGNQVVTMIEVYNVESGEVMSRKPFPPDGVEFDVPPGCWFRIVQTAMEPGAVNFTAGL